MAPVVRRLAADPEIESVVCATGQHRQMLDQVLGDFGIQPDFDLDLMAEGQSLNGLSAQVLASVDAVLEQVRPDRVLVHGDTTTAMTAALAAFQRRLPVGHVEAGLRTYDLHKPWPEEMNRRIVDLACDLLFAPSDRAASNLARERLQGRVIVTGNTVIDAVQQAQAVLAADPGLSARIDAGLPKVDPNKQVIVVTAHRRESFGPKLHRICHALRRLARRGDVEIIFPVHLNPNVRDPVHRILGGLENVHLLPPQNYFPFVRLLQDAALVLTDSGGVQEEAPALGKPVLVMRDVTERPEGVEAGVAVLVGADSSSILEATQQVLNDASVRSRFVGSRNPYGDGQAAARIVASLKGAAVAPFVARAGP